MATVTDYIIIETYNNIARYNLIDTQCHQMVFQSRVSGDCQRETTHEFCCLAAEYKE